MIILMSPTKTQSANKPTDIFLKTQPAESEKVRFLVTLLKQLTITQLSALLKISESLTMKTHNLIKTFSDDDNNTLSAIYLFQGEAFQKLDASSLTQDQLYFAQDHMIILSALYGYLKPLDGVSSYRLDMKDALKIPNHENLYYYWKDAVTLGLNKLLSKQKTNIILNLASGEYFNMIDLKKLTGFVANVEFKVRKNNEYKTIGIYAKRGRGLLARYIIDREIDAPQQIVNFNADGFSYSQSLSTSDNYVFVYE